MESKFRLLRTRLELWFDSVNPDFIDLPELLGLAELMEAECVLMRRKNSPAAVAPSPRQPKVTLL